MQMVEKSIKLDVTAVKHPNGDSSLMITKKLKGNRSLTQSQLEVLSMVDAIFRRSENSMVRSENFNADHSIRKYYGYYVIERNIHDNSVIINDRVNADGILDMINNFTDHVYNEFDDER